MSTQESKLKISERDVLRGKRSGFNKEKFYSDTDLMANEENVSEDEKYTIDLDQIMQKFYLSGMDFLSFYRDQNFNQKDEKVASKKTKTLKVNESENLVSSKEEQMPLFPLIEKETKADDFFRTVKLAGDVGPSKGNKSLRKIEQSFSSSKSKERQLSLF